MMGQCYGYGAVIVTYDVCNFIRSRLMSRKDLLWYKVDYLLFWLECCRCRPKSSLSRKIVKIGNFPQEIFLKLIPNVTSFSILLYTRVELSASLYGLSELSSIKFEIFGMEQNVSSFREIDKAYPLNIDSLGFIVVIKSLKFISVSVFIIRLLQSTWSKKGKQTKYGIFHPGSYHLLGFLPFLRSHSSEHRDIVV